MSLCLLTTQSCMKRYYHKQFMEYKSMEQKCISQCQDWILLNSKYPSSYLKVSFTRLEETAIAGPKGKIIKIMRTVSNSERISMIHKYYLQDSSQQILLAYSKFIYDKNFNLKLVLSSLTDSTVNVNELESINWKSTFGK